MPRLTLEDPNGRVDVLLARSAQRIAEHCGLGEVYQKTGACEVLEEAIRRTVPATQFSAVEIADACGLLPKKRGVKRVR